MSIDLLINITERQGAHAQGLFLLEMAPLVGAVVSVPGILMSLILSVTRVSQAAFNVIQTRWNKPPENYEMQQAQLIQDASDWGIIFLNQIANLCTVGILNNIIVSIALNNATYSMNAEEL